MYYTCAYGEGSGGLDRCANIQGDLAYSESEAVATVDRILQQVGLGAQRNFKLIPCAGIRGALAGIDDKMTRFIWYDNDFMEGLKRSSNSDWASWSVLAHEIAHHLQGHTLTESDLAQSREDELAADYFSGFVLARLGANLEQAQAAVRTFPDVYDERISRHPKQARRRTAIERGYTDAASHQYPGGIRSSARGTDVTRTNIDVGDSLKRIVASSPNGFTDLLGEQDSRKDTYKSKVSLPGATETIVTPHHSVQAWMYSTERMADAESYYNSLVGQLKLAFPDWRHREENPYKQTPIKSFVSTAPNGRTYISLYFDHGNGQTFYVKLNIFTRD